jgi:hypothetical protein
MKWKKIFFKISNKTCNYFFKYFQYVKLISFNENDKEMLKGIYNYFQCEKKTILNKLRKKNNWY